MSLEASLIVAHHRLSPLVMEAIGELKLAHTFKPFKLKESNHTVGAPVFHSDLNRFPAYEIIAANLRMCHCPQI